MGGFRQPKQSSTSKAGVPPCTCCCSHRKQASRIYLDGETCNSRQHGAKRLLCLGKMSICNIRRRGEPYVELMEQGLRVAGAPAVHPAILEK